MMMVHNTQPSTHRTLAALAAVIHRRTGKDEVSIGLRAPGSAGADLTLTLNLADDPTWRVLTARAAQAVASAQVAATAGAPGGAPADEPEVTVELGPDGSIVYLDAPPDPAAGPVELPVRAAVRAVLSMGEEGGEERGEEGGEEGGDGPDEVAVSRLRLMSDDEVDLLAGWDGRGATDPVSLCVHELVLAQAVRTPDAVAVRGARTLTYAQLDRESAALAGTLRALDVDAGTVVGVLLHRDPRLVVTLLAILRAGGAYLALDPNDHETRHAQLLADAGVALVVTEASLRGRIPAGVPTHVVAETVDPPDPGDLAGIDRGGAGRLAYISYTSGSTGEPKGVAVPHRAVTRLVREPNWVTIRADDVFLQLAPVSFDASTLELWAPLAHGAELALFPPGPVDLDEVARTLREKRVTVLWLTAGLFHQMVAAHLDAFAGLRHLVAGGDVLGPGQVRTLMAAHPQLSFTNGYGPTENTTFTTCWTSTTAPAPGATVPIGRPINGTGVAVLDARLRPVPVGVRGELYTMGAGLADGYLNRPGATADRFVPCPYPGRAGQRMYRTGDLARWLPGGELEFLGRVDQQVKIQGYRVEPSAVEAELSLDPRVQQAAVVTQPDSLGGKRLLAYVTLVDGLTAQSHDIGVQLRERISRTLPDYAVPWAVLIRGSLPLNRNGKVDRQALPTATRVPRNVWNEFVPARNLLESTVADIWGSVLSVEPIGVEDDFFDLGGHSLLAVDLIDTLRTRLDVNLQARVLYLQPTVAELAKNLIALSPSLAASLANTEVPQP